ncbi:MAG: hypothetical protein LBL59_08350 [Xanthomonadaceae bacterium]|nr:hypothetical protein [Xanthomonadaceae bacterium]
MASTMPGADTQSEGTYPLSGIAAQSAHTGNVPASLAGTAIDGGIRFDANDFPIPDAELKRLFDWFLAALGEQGPEHIRQRLADELKLRCTPLQAQRVLALFDRYVAYLRATSELDAGSDDLKERLAALKTLRARMLGADVSEGFFDDEESQAQRVLALKELSTRTDLTPEQRAQAEQQIKALSPDYAQAQVIDQQQQDAQALNRMLDSVDATATERFAARRDLFGAEAAERFASLDQQQAQWDSQLREYQRQRDNLARRNLTDAQRQTEQQRLLSGFSESQRRRIESLERAGLLGAR